MLAKEASDDKTSLWTNASTAMAQRFWVFFHNVTILFFSGEFRYNPNI